jgi:hypothetical protein
MADVYISEVGETFESIGGFEWNFVWSVHIEDNLDSHYLIP